MTALPAEVVEVLSGVRKWAVICADNSEVLPLLGDKSVDHVITDSPYAAAAMKNARSAESIKKRRDGVVYDFGYSALTDSQRDAVSEQIARVVRRWVVSWCDIESAGSWRETLTAHGLRYIRTAAWFRENGAPQFSGDRPAQDIEACVIAHAAGEKLRWNGGGRGGSAKGPIVNSQADEREHSSPKPLWLMERQILDFTDPGDLVLEPYAGSGTTMAAALRNGRRAIGIEIDCAFAKLAHDRCASEDRGQSLREYRAGQLHMFADGGK